MKKNTIGNPVRSKQKGPNAPRKANIKTATKLTVGIDLGDQKSAYCILDAEGGVLSEGTFRTSESGFAQQFRACRVAESR